MGLLSTPLPGASANRRFEAGDGLTADPGPEMMPGVELPSCGLNERLRNTAGAGSHSAGTRPATGGPIRKEEFRSASLSTLSSK
jgi:hypothetical protein